MAAKPIKLSALPSPRLMALVYGAPGVGKTVFAASSQQLRTLILDVDRGAISARTWRGDKAQGLGPTRLDQVELIECPTFEDVLAGHKHAAVNANRFDLLVVDTMTELQRMVIQQLCARAGLEVASQREWGIALSMMDDLTRAFKALPMHVVCTAHETVGEDGEHPGRYKYRPAFQGQFRDYYARHFTLVARYTLRTVEVKNAAGQAVATPMRALQCQKSPQADAKERTGALQLWEPPDLDRLLAKITQRLAEPAAAEAVKVPVTA